MRNRTSTTTSCSGLAAHPSRTIATRAAIAALAAIATLPACSGDDGGASDESTATGAARATATGAGGAGGASGSSSAAGIGGEFTTTGAGAGGAGGEGGAGGNGQASGSSSTTGSGMPDAGPDDDGGAGGGGPVCENPAPGTGTFAWSRRAGNDPGQYGQGIAVDGAGNVLVTGSFAGSIDFGGGTLTSAGDDDVFVAKLDPAGNHVWSKRFGTGKGQFGRAVAADPNGNVLLAGYFVGSIDFGGGKLTEPGCCFENVFVVKLDPAGNHVWSKHYGDVNGQYARGIAADAAGNVVFAGDFQTNVDFGGGKLTSAGGYDAYVTKLDATGAHLWSERFGDGKDQTTRALAVDSAGNVVVTGDAQGAIDFGGGPLVATGQSATFVAKLGPTGTHLWSKIFGQGASSGRAIGVDAAGNVFVAGDFQGEIDFGGGKMESPINTNVFVVKLDPAGNHVWSKNFGDALAEKVQGLAVDALGRSVVVGEFNETISFGGDTLTSAGIFDIFVAKLDSYGCHVWSRSFGNPLFQTARSVALGPGGDVAITGTFAGTLDFGGGAITANGDDLFVAKFGP